MQRSVVTTRADLGILGYDVCNSSATCNIVEQVPEVPIVRTVTSTGVINKVVGNKTGRYWNGGEIASGQNVAKQQTRNQNNLGAAQSKHAKVGPVQQSSEMENYKAGPSKSSNNTKKSTNITQNKTPINLRVQHLSQFQKEHRCRSQRRY